MVHQLAFEVVDLLVGPPPVGLGAEALHPFDQHPPVPATVEDREPTAARHVPPEPPQVRLGALRLVRRRDRDHPVVPRVERVRDPPDRAPLPRRVDPLEHRDHRPLLAEPWLTRQQVQPALEPLELVGVPLLRHRRRQVEVGDQAARVDRGRGDGRGRRRRRGPIEPLADRVQHRAPDHYAAVVRVGALHHRPRGLGGAGAAQRVLGALPEPVVVLEPLPIGLGDPPARRRVLLERGQPRLLRRLRQVEPELQHQHAVADQHPLMPRDRLQPLVEGRRLQRAADAVDDRLGVPRAEQDADVTFRGQCVPEPPHRRALAGVLVRRAEGVGVDVARVHPLVEQVHRLSLACAVDAADQHQHRELLAREQLVLRVEQPLAQRRHLRVVGLPLHPVPQLRRVEHPLPSGEAALYHRRGAGLPVTSCRPAAAARGARR